MQGYISEKKADGMARVSTMPYLYNIAEGQVARHTPWSKIGYAPTVAATETDLWSKGGAYVFPTAADNWAVVSSDTGPNEDKGTSIFDGTSSGGSTTSLVDATKDFTAGTPVVAGDCIILDKSGTTPEWGYVTGVTANTLTVAGGFSSGGTGASRAYYVLDKSATTGAQAVKLEYLTTAYAQKSEIFIMNDNTEVNGVNTDMYRCNSFRIIAMGTAGVSSGAISLKQRTAVGSTVYSYITAKYTRARNSVYTIPAGKVLYVTQFSGSYATTGNANKEYGRLYTRANMEPSTRFKTLDLFYAYTEIMLQNNTIPVELTLPTQIPAGIDIKVSCYPSANGFATSVLRGWLETP